MTTIYQPKHQQKQMVLITFLESVQNADSSNLLSTRFN